MQGTARISVIIPTLNEQESIASLIGLLVREGVDEIIVADGESIDSTVRIAKCTGAIITSSAKGRGSQLNCGASVASGEILVFLHADTLPPNGLTSLIRQALSQNDIILGAFSLSIRDPALKYRLVELLTNLRSHLFSLPYGDQGLFIRKADFISLGGFAEIPLMEDYDFVRRARKTGKILTLSSRVITSGRRWRKHGLLNTFFLNQALMAGFRLGISPQTLWNLYYKN